MSLRWDGALKNFCTSSFFFLLREDVHTSITTSIMFPTKTVIFGKQGAYFVFSLYWAWEWKAHFRSWEGLRTILHQSWEKASKRLSCLFNFWHFSETDRPTLTPPTPFLPLLFAYGWCGAQLPLNGSPESLPAPKILRLWSVWGLQKKRGRGKKSTDSMTDILMLFWFKRTTLILTGDSEQEREPVVRHRRSASPNEQSIKRHVVGICRCNSTQKEVEERQKSSLRVCISEHLDRSQTVQPESAGRPEPLRCPWQSTASSAYSSDSRPEGERVLK